MASVSIGVLPIWGGFQAQSCQRFQPGLHDVFASALLPSFRMSRLGPMTVIPIHHISVIFMTSWFGSHTSDSLHISSCSHLMQKAHQVNQACRLAVDDCKASKLGRNHCLGPKSPRYPRSNPRMSTEDVKPTYHTM